MALDSSTPTTLPSLGNLAGQLGGSTASTNPLSTTAEDALQVDGVGALLRLNWGKVSVAQALAGLGQLAKAANGKTSGAVAAKAQLIAIQEQMYAAGLYGAKRPTFGVFDSTEDEAAFRKVLVTSAQSGQKVGTVLTSAATTAQQTGTAGSGTHIIPAARIQEKVWQPQDILAAINAATTATGDDLAQKLIGRDFTEAELQGAANSLNVAQGQQTAADVQGALQQQEQDIATSQAVYGQPASSVDIGGRAP